MSQVVNPTEPHTAHAAWARPAAATALTILVVLWAYAPGFRGDFVYDDRVEILENPALAVLWPPWVPMFEGGQLPHRPLAYYTFALNRAVGGVDPWGYHAVNLAFHGLNGWLIWWITRRTLARAGDQRADWIAWLASLLWLVHPLGTQAVTYIYQRMEVMAATSILATLACFIRSLDSPQPRIWQVSAVLIAACGGLCKETAVATPAVVLLYDLCCGGADGGPPERGAVWRRAWLHAWLFATWAVTIGVVVVQRARFPELVRPNFGALDYALTQPLAILHYLWLVFWPYRQCFDVEWTVASDPLTIAGGCTALALIGVAVLAACRLHAGSVFVVLCFLALLAPTSSVFPVNYLYGEHRMYLPSAVLVVAVVWAAATCARPGRRQPFSLVALTIVGVALAGAMATLTAARNAVYESRIGLWEETLATVPQNSTAHIMLAGALLDEGRADAALAAVDRAVALSPGQAFAHTRRAETLFDLGRIDEAVEAARRAIVIQPRMHGAHATLLAALLRRGDAEAAASAGEEAIRMMPNLVSGPMADANTASLFTNLGVAWAMTGDPRAVQAFERALDTDRGSARAWYNLAKATWQQDLSRGLGLVDHALTLDPQCVDARQLREIILRAAEDSTR